METGDLKTGALLPAVMSSSSVETDDRRVPNQAERKPRRRPSFDHEIESVQSTEKDGPSDHKIDRLA